MSTKAIVYTFLGGFLLVATLAAGSHPAPMKQAEAAPTQAVSTLVKPAAVSNDTTVDSAYAICRKFDAIHMLSDRCEVSGWNRSVTIVLDIPSNEARKLCQPIKSNNDSTGLRFRDGWTLRVKSPYSGDSAIAICDLS